MVRNQRLFFGRLLQSVRWFLCAQVAFFVVGTAAGQRASARSRSLPTAFRRAVRAFEHVEQFAPQPFDVEAALAEDAQRQQRGGPLRFAFRRAVDITTNDYGLWESLDDETLMWRLQVTSPDAVSLNLGFEEFYMPPSGKVYIYSVDGSRVTGPFTERHNKRHGRLWTPIIESDDVVVELTISVREAESFRLRLSSIYHGYRKFSDESKNKGLGEAGSCNVNAACPEGDQWRDQIRSVAKYFVSGPRGSYTCTGTLLNNTGDNGKPFFLTAFHCFDDVDLLPGNGSLSDPGSIAETIIVDWNYEASSCTGTAPFADHSQSGAVFRAGYSDSDFVLVELDEVPSPEYGVFYAGWDRRSAPPTSAVTIHHPSGDLKKISREDDPLWIISYLDNPQPSFDTHLRVDDWDVGTTEAGSSGCALFNSTGRVVGQLHGGDAACGNNLPDWFGRFFKSWTGGGTSTTRLSDWLDPLGSGVLYIDGKDGRPPVDPFEPDNSFDLADVIEPGSTQTRSLLPAGDVDWAKFSIDTVAEVIIETSGSAGDTQMWLYDENLVEIGFNDDNPAGGYFSRIERLCGVNPLSPGTYYVRIDEYNNDNAILEYNLDLTVANSPVADVTGDCLANLTDFGVLADEWLQCRTVVHNKLTAGDAAETDQFGQAVSISGDYAVIGSPFDTYAGVQYSGSAYVFTRIGSAWVLQVKLNNPGPGNSDFFGSSVAVDGDYIVIGARKDNDKAANSGSAYVFKRQGGAWNMQTKLTAPDGARDDFFGYSVSISGRFALIGCPYDDDNGSSSGSVYVFERNGVTWVYQDKLLADDGATNDYLGWSVSISGGHAIAGANGDDDRGNSSGAAYVFAYDETRSEWIQEAKLTASDGVADAVFGCSVDIDATQAVAGAWGADGNVADSGAAYTFEHDGTGWNEQMKLISSDGKGGDHFGVSVALSANTALVGANLDDDNGESSGSVYVFMRKPSGWTEKGKLLAPAGSADDQFGCSVSLSGKSAITGAFHDSDRANWAGAAFVFDVGIEPMADIDADGCVDMKDLARFVEQWLRPAN